MAHSKPDRGQQVAMGAPLGRRGPEHVRFTDLYRRWHAVAKCPRHLHGLRRPRVMGLGSGASSGTRLAAAMVGTGTFLSLACGPDVPEPRVVGSTTAVGAPVRIEDPARLQVGREGDSLLEFHGVVTPFLLPDETLVVPLSGAGILRLFRPDGSFAGDFGGEGQGPGEFIHLLKAWPRGDTIEAFDYRLRRITRILPDGELEVLPPFQGGGDSAVPGFLSNAWVGPEIVSAGFGERDQMVIRTYGQDGRPAAEIARVEGLVRYAHARGGGPHPLSPRAALAVHGEQIYVAETLTPRIEVRDRDGTLINEVTWDPVSNVSPGDAMEAVSDLAVARAERLGGNARDRPSYLSDPAAVRRVIAEAGVPDRVPVFSTFLVDELGFIWIRPYDPEWHSPLFGDMGAGPGGTWLILSPEGTEAGTVAVPDGLEPSHISEDHVVGVRTDELGIESVQVHELTRH